MKHSPKKPLLIAGIVFAAFALLFAASFLPTLWLNTGMHTLQGDWITVFYERQEAAAQDVFALAEAEAQRLTQKLGFDERQDLQLYIYDKRSTFQTKKYGLIATMLNLPWYIGDNRGTTVLLASPGEVTNPDAYNMRKHAAPHEMVHALNSILNPQMPLWLNEGAALYLTNGYAPDDLYVVSPTPTLAQTATANPVAFSNMGGYLFAHTYVEYLDTAYGWERVLTLLKTGDYQAAIGISREAAYQEWIGFLQEHYSGKSV